MNKPTVRKGLAAVVGTAVAVAALTFTGHNEGVSLVPYKDHLAREVNTVCYGDTGIPMRTYTLSECQELLDTRLAVYAEPVKNSTPGFSTLTVGQQVAAIDFAWNVGVPAYKTSTVRRMYIAKQFPAACDQYLRWNESGGKDCRVAANGCGGIMVRRQRARSICRGETP